MQANLTRSCLLATGFAVLLAGQVGTAQSADEPVVMTQQGRASFYGGKFHGKRTASGNRFNQHDLVAAHPYLPFGSVVKVTNLRNGRETYVRVVDRGPAPSARRQGRVIDLSLGAARQLGFVAQGTAPVQLAVLRNGTKRGKIIASNQEEFLNIMY
ncbi:MAG: septal ring lytic transglycosylase RlpA family protein [Candidatus Competibacteraceae bacterium]